MNALPVAPPPSPAPPVSPPPAGGAGVPSLPPITRPTERPSEPLTAGLSVGAGPGPEALNLQTPNDSDLIALAPYLPVLELLSSQPNATVATRNLIRRVRGASPLEAVQRDNGLA